MIGKFAENLKIVKKFLVRTQFSCSDITKVFYYFFEKPNLQGFGKDLEHFEIKNIDHFMLKNFTFPKNGLKLFKLKFNFQF